MATGSRPDASVLFVQVDVQVWGHRSGGLTHTEWCTAPHTELCTEQGHFAVVGGDMSIAPQRPVPCLSGDALDKHSLSLEAMSFETAQHADVRAEEECQHSPNSTSILAILVGNIMMFGGASQTRLNHVACESTV